MAMSTPTITNYTTAAFKAIHPASIGVDGTHDMSHLGDIVSGVTGRAVLWYCSQDNALNIDLVA